MRSGYVFIFYFLSYKLISRSGCRYANWSPGFNAVLLTSCLLCLKFYLLNVLNSAWFLSKRIKSFGLDFVVFRWRKFFSLSTFLFWESNSALLIKRLTHPMKRAVFSWVVTAFYSPDFSVKSEFGFKALLIPSLRETLSILNVLFNKRCVSARGGRGGAESAGWAKGLSSLLDGSSRPPCLSCGLRDILSIPRGSPRSVNLWASLLLLTYPILSPS